MCTLCTLHILNTAHCAHCTLWAVNTTHSEHCTLWTLHMWTVNTVNTVHCEYCAHYEFEHCALPGLIITDQLVQLIVYLEKCGVGTLHYYIQLHYISITFPNIHSISLCSNWNTVWYLLNTPHTHGSKKRKGQRLRIMHECTFDMYAQCTTLQTAECTMYN